MGDSYLCLTPCWAILSRIADSGIDLENPRPDQKSVGIRDSPIAFCCIAENETIKIRNRKGYYYKLRHSLTEIQMCRNVLVQGIPVC